MVKMFQGTYDLQNLQLKITPTKPIPKGEYKITAQASDSAGSIACYLINASYR